MSPGIDIVIGCADRPTPGTPIAHVAAPVVLRDLVSTTLSNLCARTTLATPLALVGPAQLAALPGLLASLALPRLLTRLATLLPAGLALAGLPT